MKKFMEIFVVTLLLMSCSREGMRSLPEENVYMEELGHEMIVLGKRLENPYTTENMRDAYHAVYPTKSREEVQTTNLYVRFLPENQEEFDRLLSLGLELIDHPVDYEILKEGDYYHDPAVGKDRFTWQYVVVPKDFEFPDIHYELIDECFLADNSPQSRAMTDVDWTEVEKQAYVMSGNEKLLQSVSPHTKAVKQNPSGRITIVDEDYNGGQPFGLAGVRVSCNSFVKFASCYTDRDGYYTMPKQFSANLRFRIVFKNEKGFALGVNLILLPASVSALGTAKAEGLDYLITKESEKKLFNRAVVNNAAYDYISRCAEEDMNIATPPDDLRIWLFNKLSCSSAVMIHHGAVVNYNLIQRYLGEYSLLVQFFAPDITIGTKGQESYLEIYDSVVHELSHASHFSQVGAEYWNRYIAHIIQSFLITNGETYGDGNEPNAGYCEVGEMWAYYVESMMHKERYGGSVPAYGTSFWFYPQIFRYADDRGLSRSDIFKALSGDVASRDELKTRLLELYPNKSNMLEQVFTRYR